VKELSKIAEEIGVSITNMALAWCLKNPNVSTLILGASKPEQLQENLGCLEVVKKLTPEVLEKIETVLNNKGVYPEY
jgi:aryl-alcohol dehydrogenase-like predicted oxidoreductase